MQNSKLIAILKDLGLSEHEAQVYFAALSLGRTTILKISRASAVKRTTIYSVLENLKRRGLIRVELKGWKTFYVAESPERLEQIMESRKEKLRKAFPEFMSLFNLEGGESVIKYYEGMEALKGTMEDTLKLMKPDDWYLIISNSTTWHERDPKWFYGFLERRAQVPLQTRALFQDSEFARLYLQKQHFYKQPSKILPPGTPFSALMTITPYRLVIQQLAEPMMAIVVENKSIIQMQKELFEIIWRALPE